MSDTMRNAVSNTTRFRIEIDEALVQKIATLARLRLSDDEAARFATDMRDILAAFEELDEADDTGVPSSFRPFEERNHLRTDEPRPSLSNDEALVFAKYKEHGFFIGPRTVE